MNGKNKKRQVSTNYTATKSSPTRSSKRKHETKNPGRKVPENRARQLGFDELLKRPHLFRR